VIKMIDKQSCMSQYIAFRYVVSEDIQWSRDIRPKRFKKEATEKVDVKDSYDIENYIRYFIERYYDEETAILLSGGIDSAIIASFLREGTAAYTIRFLADQAIDESVQAAKYAQEYKLKHIIIDVSWKDYETLSPSLMKNKNAPLHPVEVALYKAALTIRSHGYKKIIIGNGADSNFGGMDKLLSKDWSYTEFIRRYNFNDPEKILNEPSDITHIYAKYMIKPDLIDIFGFLHDIHGYGIIQAFENALVLAGCSSLEPYENMNLAVPLDIDRIRSGQSKYFLRELFARRYSKITVPDKIPFARPMDDWLKDWKGPVRGEFKELCTIGLSGEQKWIVYCLERYLDLIFGKSESREK
jgi:hypothetical protein